MSVLRFRVRLNVPARAHRHRRAEALFKKEQQSREAQQATAEYDAEQRAVQEKTARLRALRLARDAANQGGAAEPNTTRRAPTGRASR
jgi:polyphosphate kinase 2 (PPK2 family)